MKSHTTPLISIIVAVLNGERTLDVFFQTIQSQSFINFELILIESGSTDNTPKIIDQFVTKIPQLKVITTEFMPLYSTLNMGLILAKGEWLYFMGCDDVFYDETALQRASTYLNSASYDYVSGVVVQVPSGRVFRPRPITQWLFHSLHHQGTFYHKNIFEKYKYNETLRIAADYELTLRLYLNNFRLKVIHEPIAYFSETGMSGNNKHLAWAECADIRRRVYGKKLGTLLNILVRALLKIKGYFQQRQYL